MAQNVTSGGLIPVWHSCLGCRMRTRLPAFASQFPREAESRRMCAPLRDVAGRSGGWGVVLAGLLCLCFSLFPYLPAGAALRLQRQSSTGRKLPKRCSVLSCKLLGISVLLIRHFPLYPARGRKGVRSRLPSIPSSPAFLSVHGPDRGSADRRRMPLLHGVLWTLGGNVGCADFFLRPDACA